jgi:hypothetical protein
MHEVGANEARERERAVGDFGCVMRQPQQKKGDERDGDLDANGVLRRTDEMLDPQGLLNPAKEQLDRPAATSSALA